MEISEIQFRELIQRVMELTLEWASPEKAAEKKTGILVVLSGDNDAKFANTLRELQACGRYDVTVALSREQMETERIGQVVCSTSQKIIEMKRVLQKPLPYERILFPVMPREILAKCALCIPDTCEVRIVQRALEENIPVSIAKNGLDPFTGNEPVRYQEQILEYIRRLLEYGIDIQMDEKER